jgi:hypothetical protein
MESSYPYTVTIPGVALLTPGALFNMSGNVVLDFIPTARLILPRKGYPNVVFWARGRGLPSNLNVDLGIF